VTTAVVDVREGDQLASAIAGAGRPVRPTLVRGQQRRDRRAFGFITEIDGDGAAVTFPVLVKGAFYGIKHGVRAMRAHSGGGSVVNIASAAGTGGGYGPLPTRRPRRRW
jgi:NAD(P)-dependent dehydrogenase (short-subunit alcohol dehydrogenase family)